MYICLCRSVSDRQVRSAIAQGARSLRDIARETGLGSCCGKCVPETRGLLAEALSEQPVPLSMLGSIAYTAA